MTRIEAGAKRRITLTIPFYVDAELYEAFYLLSIQTGKSMSRLIWEILDHLSVPVNAENLEMLLLEHPAVRRAVEMVSNEPDDCTLAIGSRESRAAPSS